MNTMLLKWCLVWTNSIVFVICAPHNGHDIVKRNDEDDDSGQPLANPPSDLPPEITDVIILASDMDEEPPEPSEPIEGDIMVEDDPSDDDSDEPLVFPEILYLEAPDDSPPTTKDEPEEEKHCQHKFECDIKLTEEQKDALENLEEKEEDVDDDDNDNVMDKRKGIGNLANRWPDAVVPYVIDPSISDSAGILKAMRHWEYHTCIRFQELTPELENELGHSDHAYFEKGDSFWSYVGRCGLGAQTVSIADEIRIGSIAHELGHVIGFWHEQARPDRDDYVTIDFNNVMPGAEKAFRKYDWDQVLTHDIPYDVGSIMHYGPYYFSNNGLPTIIAKSPEDQDKLGNRMTLSKHDIKLANLMYDCPDAAHCTDRSDNCAWWTKKGFCETGKYVGYMMNSCAKSCDVCHQCVNKNAECDSWAEREFCDHPKYRAYMKSKCKLACKVCVILDE